MFIIDIGFFIIEIVYLLLNCSSFIKYHITHCFFPSGQTCPRRPRCPSCRTSPPTPREWGWLWWTTDVCPVYWNSSLIFWNISWFCWNISQICWNISQFIKIFVEFIEIFLEFVGLPWRQITNLSTTRQSSGMWSRFVITMNANKICSKSMMLK